MKKIIVLLMSLIMVLLCAVPGMAQTASEEEGYEYEDVFAEWNPEAPALQLLIEYVETVTDEDSPDYIPPERRIATFDMDGTLYGELFPTYFEYYMLAWRILKDPSFQPDEEMLEVGRTIRDCALDKSFPADMPVSHAVQAARAYAGMTLGEFADFTTEVLVRDADGFEGLIYGEALYLPMIEVVDYLQENGFKVFVVSGSDRFICRILLEGNLDVPYENIIGMDVAMEATGQNGADGLDYVFEADDDVVRTDHLLIKNLQMNKVTQIVQDIGIQPVISFGNSSGDVSMHMYTIHNNPFKSIAFMLIADDELRDYGNEEKAGELRTKWEEMGFHVISMKNDFRTIYGDDVVKTGSFHWMEELQEDPERSVAAAELTAAETEAPAEEPAEIKEEAEASAEEPAMTGEEKDVQYVMYLGTNDKDSNEPVFTPEEAMEAAKSILVKHFGGYTIQDAQGGWVGDDGTLYQEYTLVIYLSDTDIDKVHEAADEMIDVFHQSSVLIQTNESQTEFYYRPES